jgi:hypothetical protein
LEKTFGDIKKRAYFVLNREEKEKRINYISETGRKVARTVVKRRESAKYVSHENEGIAYSVERIENEWAISIKPIYMFTSRDGNTLLSGYRRGKLSTRRIKFDRNQNVRDDLFFWAAFLCKGKETLRIGAPDSSSIVIKSRFVECEIPTGKDQSL